MIKNWLLRPFNGYNKTNLFFLLMKYHFLAVVALAFFPFLSVSAQSLDVFDEQTIESETLQIEAEEARIEQKRERLQRLRERWKNLSDAEKQAFRDRLKQKRIENGEIEKKSNVRNTPARLELEETKDQFLKNGEFGLKRKRQSLRQRLQKKLRIESSDSESLNFYERSRLARRLSKAEAQEVNRGIQGVQDSFNSGLQRNRAQGANDNRADISTAKKFIRRGSTTFLPRIRNVREKPEATGQGRSLFRRRLQSAKDKSGDVQRFESRVKRRSLPGNFSRSLRRNRPQEATRFDGEFLR